MAMILTEEIVGGFNVCEKVVPPFTDRNKVGTPLLFCAPTKRRLGLIGSMTSATMVLLIVGLARMVDQVAPPFVERRTVPKVCRVVCTAYMLLGLVGSMKTAPPP